jgi:hypothetical protein
MSLDLCHLICAQCNAWRWVVQVRVLRRGASCRNGLRKTGACGKHLRNQRHGRHKSGRVDPTSPASRRAGWLGPLSLKLDHCGSPNRIRAGHQSLAEMPERRLTALAIIPGGTDPPVAGGESGIRTHGTVSRTHAFQACALSHSAISPYRLLMKAAADFCKGEPRLPAEISVKY